MKRTFSIALASLLFALSPLSGQDSKESAPVPADYPGKPLGGKPQVIPGTIQVEAYDQAPGDAKNVTVGYRGSLKKTEFRPEADSAGVAKYGAGHVLITGEAENPEQVYCGWTESGQWMTYTVEVKEAGVYVIGGKFAAGGKGSLASLTFGTGLGTGPMEIPSTEGYQPNVEVYHVWEKLDHLQEITLPAGILVMKMKIDRAAGLNIDYFTFTKKP